MSDSEEIFPDFFIAGAPKCGTTSLYDWLSGHPQIFMPGKELCFFSQDIYPTDRLRGHIPSLEAYRALFAEGAAQGKRLGDATPKYLHSDLALAEIARLATRPRIIVCLRDPVDFAISLHTQKVRDGWEREQDFSAAWLRESKVASKAPAASRSGEMNYVFWAHLGRRLEKVFEYFEQQDVLLILLDEMRAEPGDVYRKVLDFIGVEHDGRTTFTASNPGSGVVSFPLHRGAVWFHRLSDPLVRPLRKLRGGRGFGLLKALNAANTVEGAYASQVPQSVRAQMYEGLGDDIARCERYLGGRRLTRGSDRP